MTPRTTGDDPDQAPDPDQADVPDRAQESKPDPDQALAPEPGALLHGAALGPGRRHRARALFDGTQDPELSRWVFVASWAVFTVGLILAFGVPWGSRAG